MIIKCPKCPNIQNLGADCESIADRAYLLSCPVVMQALHERGGQAEDIDCPHMRKVRTETIHKFRRGQLSGD